MHKPAKFSGRHSSPHKFFAPIAANEKVFIPFENLRKKPRVIFGIGILTAASWGAIGWGAAKVVDYLDRHDHHAADKHEVASATRPHAAFVPMRRSLELK